MIKKKSKPDPKKRLINFDKAWNEMVGDNDFEKFRTHKIDAELLKYLHDKMRDWVSREPKKGNKVRFKRFISNWIWRYIGEHQGTSRRLPDSDSFAKGGPVKI